MGAWIEIVKVCLPGPVWPPKLRILDGHGNDHLVVAFVQFRLVLDFLPVAVPVVDVQHQRTGQLFVCLDFHFHLGNPRSGGILRRLGVLDVKVVDFHVIPRLNIDVVPDAAGVELRPPVPAALVLRLAGEDAVVGELVGQF